MIETSGMRTSVEVWLRTYADLDQYVAGCSSEEQLLELSRRMAEDANQSGVMLDPEEAFSALLKRMNWGNGGTNDVLPD